MTSSSEFYYPFGLINLRADLDPRKHYAFPIIFFLYLGLTVSWGYLEGSISWLAYPMPAIIF